MRKGSEEYRQYIREYSKRRYEERIQAALTYLGGKCIKCGSTTNLEFDHIDRSTKIKSVTSLTRHKEEVFWTEVKKCQLLCSNCHDQKSYLEDPRPPARGSHGTLSSYQYCRCEECRAAFNKYKRELRKRKCNIAI